MFQFLKLTLRTHLGLILVSKSPSSIHIKSVMAKVRPHLDYGGIIFDQDFNDTFTQKELLGVIKGENLP